MFCPAFTEYRDCVIVVKGNAVGPTEVDPDEQVKAIIDDWFAGGHSRTTVEAKVNLLNMFDMFMNVDITPFEDDLPGLAHSIAECWHGLLRLRYPDRQFTVEVHDDSGAGPELTFSSLG